MPPKRIDRSLRDLKDTPAPVRGLDAVRERVMSGVSDQTFRRGPTRFFIQVSAGIGAIILSASGATAAAQFAMPGDALYGVKRLSENAWLSVQLSPESRMHTERAMLERRYSEAASGTYAAEDYERTVREAASGLDDAAERGDPEVISAEAESFSDMLSEHADRLDLSENEMGATDREKMDDAIVEGMLRADEAIVKTAELHEAKRFAPTND